MKKIILISFMLIVLPLFAKDASITTKTREYDNDKDGKNEVIIKTTYRNGKLILTERIDKKDPKGCFRIYKVGSQNVIESDKDGDGFFEELQIYGKNLASFDIFIRTKDGKITPIDSKKISQLTEAEKKLKADINKELETTINEMLKKIADEDGKPTPDYLKKAIDEHLKNEKTKNPQPKDTSNSDSAAAKSE